MRSRLLGSLTICLLAAYGCGGNASHPPDAGDAASDRSDTGGSDTRTDTRTDRGGDTGADSAADVPANPDGADAAPGDDAPAGDGGGQTAPTPGATPAPTLAPTAAPTARRPPAPTASRTATRPASTAAATAASAARASPASVGQRLPVRGLQGRQDLRRLQRRDRLRRRRDRSASTAPAPRGVCGSARGPPARCSPSRPPATASSRQCAADGTVAVVNDDTDVPDDRNPCTNDICTAGAASHTMMPSNTNCGGANTATQPASASAARSATDCPGHRHALPHPDLQRRRRVRLHVRRRPAPS